MNNILIQTNIKKDTIKFDVSVADEKSKEKLGSEIAAPVVWYILALMQSSRALRLKLCSIVCLT